MAARPAAPHVTRHATTAPAAPAVAQAPRAQTGPVRAFAVAWAVFWLLLVTVALQDHLRRGHTDLWRPLLWELSSGLVASLLVWRLWPHVPRLDRLLAHPWRWTARPLAALPLLAPLFVGAVFAIRHAVYALVGESYRHAPWPELLVYESLKFAIFYLLFVAVFFGMRSFAAMHTERLRAEAGLALAREAQLAQLAQQIEPHFLFNALNTVASVIPDQPALAEHLLLRLAELLRAATDLTRRPHVTLAEELKLLRAYAEIMGQRFVGRVSMQWQVDETLADCRVPALILQPLLENAFRHGVERHAGRARIDIQVARAERQGTSLLRATVACSLGELAPELPTEPARGVGLANVRRRLALAHDEHATLRLEARAGGGVCATIELPCDC